MSVKIFACSESRYLGEKIAQHYGTPLGSLVVDRFSDGEISTFFSESVRGCEVFIIQSTCPPADNIMEFLLAIDAAKRASASYVTAVVPYFGYARQDRKDKPRVSIGAKLKANLFIAAGVDRLMTYDLHAGQIQGFFDIPVDHLDGTAIFIPYLKTLNSDQLTFAAPDVGGVARARIYSKYFGADLVVCDKHRARANQIASMQLIGDVKGRDIVLVDDLVDTAGTISRAATLIKENGANSVRAICTHPVLSGNAYENIENSALEELVVSDTIPLKKKSEKIRVLSTAELFAQAIRKIHDKESISSLFI
ncbi:MAG: ribose-phosphate pyrophosphokinase [Bacteroidota bacterium]